jgi:hypothetical protein
MIKIVSDPTSRLIVRSPDLRDLRKSLIHYKPEGRSMRHLAISEPIYGILKPAFPNRSFNEIRNEIYTCAENVTALLNEWAASQ